MDVPKKQKRTFGEWINIIFGGSFLSILVLMALPSAGFLLAMCLFGVWGLIGVVARSIIASTCAVPTLWCWTPVQAYIAAALILSGFGWACSLVPGIWKFVLEEAKPDEKKDEEPKHAL